MSSVDIKIQIIRFDKAKKALQDLSRALKRIQPVIKRFKVIVGYRMKARKMVNRLKQLQ